MSTQREMFEKWWDDSFHGVPMSDMEECVGWQAWQAAIKAQPVVTDDLVIALHQARYVLRDYHVKQPDCGLNKLANACEIAANMLVAQGSVFNDSL